MQWLTLKLYGTRKDTAIFQVALVIWEKDTIITKKLWNIDYRELLEKGCTYSPATMKWWKNINPKFLEDIASSFISPKEFIEDFITTYKQNSPKSLWANSPDFDCVILENIFDRYGYKIPWQYYQCKCVRTIKFCANDSSKLNNNHDALDDCLNQANIVIKLLEKLNKGDIKNV